MDIKELDEVNEALEMFKELGLPIGIEQLGQRKKLETKYIKETVAPLIQSRIQAMVEKIHESFSLLVEYKRGTPVQVTFVEKENAKNVAKLKSCKTSKSQVCAKDDVYSSKYLLEEWKEYLETQPGGLMFYKNYLTYSFHTLSKLSNMMLSQQMINYTSFLFERLQIPMNEKKGLLSIINILEPEQFAEMTTEGGVKKRIVLWTQTPKVKILEDGSRIKVCEPDGVTPVMVDKVKFIKEDQWSIKVICDLIAQKEYFAKLHESK